MENDQLENAAASIASDLVPSTEETHEVPETEVPEVKTETVEPIVAAKPPPKSWAKETHEHWTKIPTEAQDYIELREKQMLDGLEQYKGDAGLGRVMRETITPYKALLSAQGVDEGKAVQYLMNAHYKLSTLPGQQRAAYLVSLAKTYGIDLSQVQPEQPVDPRLQGLEKQVSELTESLTQAQRQQFEVARERVTGEVNAFAQEKDAQGNLVHPYFDEVADDIIALIKAGYGLKDAHDKAVWANPVTRQKEIARLQQESDAKLRAKAKQEAEAAKKAAGANVRSRDTTRTPTGPMGKMEDTMTETLKDIRSRGTTH